MERSFDIFVEAVKEGKDPYLAAASQRFQKPPEEITKAERSITKARLLRAIYASG